MTERSGGELSPFFRILVEWGPLIAFFVANAKGGIFWATGIFMAATVIALAVSWILTRKLAIVPLIGAGFVAVFGALTLWLQNDTFIKVKVTLVNALFGTILLTGLYFGKQFLKLVLGEALKMDDEGWRILTLRWGLFFFAMAGLNEIVWRTVSTDLWVNFKVFGILPLTLLFAISQAPLMNRHMTETGTRR
jgi:intracellular septation protein